MTYQMIQILLIEDDPIEADLFQEILFETPDAPFVVHWRDNLAAALLQLKEGGIDVIVSDLCLPGSRGLETFHKVQTIAPRLPIILLTAFDNEQLATQAVQLGAQDYLVKGTISRSILIRALRYAIERKRLEEVLRQREERYVLATSGANEGVWDWDLKNKTIYYSAHWQVMLGYEENEITSNPDEWFSRIHKEDLLPLKREIAAHLQGMTSRLEVEYRMKHKKGVYHWMLCRAIAVRDESGQVIRLVGAQTDITRRKMEENKLRQGAMRDVLTGLPNRLAFMERLGKTLHWAQRHPKYLFAVFFLDLDAFKGINDRLGHLAGDQLLTAVAGRLRACLRTIDMVARLGGDEFVILLDDVANLHEVELVATRIQNALTIPFEVENHKLFISSSIGVTVNTRKYKYPEELLRDADIAMYQAKAAGKSKHFFFETSLLTQAPEESSGYEVVIPPKSQQFKF